MHDAAEAFPILDDADLAQLESLGTRRSINAGDYLFRQATRHTTSTSLSRERSRWWSMLTAPTARSRDTAMVASLGEPNLLTALRFFVTARVVESGEVIVLPRHTDLSLDGDHLIHEWTALARRPLPFETHKPGLFAVGEGSAAVRAVHHYLAFSHQ